MYQNHVAQLIDSVAGSRLLKDLLSEEIFLCVLPSLAPVFSGEENGSRAEHKAPRDLHSTEKQIQRF